jgi:rfaE bifunctional protein nucleotidyltransferase chain/domain
MKIKTIKEIEEIAGKLRKQKKKIVSCNGSFDLFHIGHLRFLQESKDQGDILIVGLNSDSSIKRYKSPTRPIVAQEYRADILSALDCVDYVVIFNETNPIKLIQAIKPNVHCNGEEYGEDCIESAIVKKNGGKIHLIKKLKGFSTTELIEKIKTIK